MEIHQYLAANYSLRRNKRLHISFTIPLLMSAEFLVDGILHSYKSIGFYYCLKQLITIAWLSVWVILLFFLPKKNSLLAYVTLLRYVIRTNQIAALEYVSHTNQISALGYYLAPIITQYLDILHQLQRLGVIFL